MHMYLGIYFCGAFWLLLFFIILGEKGTPCSAQGILLFLHSGIAPGNARRITYDAKGLKPRHASYPLHYFFDLHLYFK